MTKYALVSVSDKSNLNIIVEFLYAKGYTILSTGGTYKYIYDYNENIRESLVQVSDYTGFPEILNGRVKTLHPKIYGGLLWDDRFDTTGIEKIDLVVVNLYPFQETVSNPDATLDDAIENIDIGGVSLIRAAAKNFKNTRLLTSPHDYYHATMMFDDPQFWRDMAIKGFDHVTEYDSAITQYLSNDTLIYRRYSSMKQLKYGCNPYQRNASLLTNSQNNFPFKIINGIPGYINCIDAIQSWSLVRELYDSTGLVSAASFKHTAPAGVALADRELTDTEAQFLGMENSVELNASTSLQAYIKARNCDPLSSFGDFIAICGTVDFACAKYISKCVCDGIIATNYTVEALETLFKKKSGKFIVLQGNTEAPSGIEYREIGGAVLSQDTNTKTLKLEDLNYVMTDTTQKLTTSEKRDMILATTTLKYTPSNSIAFATDNTCVGIGAGQQNRLDCIKLAGNKSREWRLRHHPKVLALNSLFREGMKRQERVNATIKYIRDDFTGNEFKLWSELFTNPPLKLTEAEKMEYLNNKNIKLVLSSDAFMPFRDNIDTANKYGVSSIVQPGGSVADSSVIGACNEYGISMVFTNTRFFLH
jgi:phosphoribosylaminoimidazolecarboxamide formyltransferase/IMP cyclohydrolase